ncbi:MAG TPA: tetratricopeptide repeat protein [Bacteroidales bacterium]|nr:tetratricopeptide repeat protein [Bacteroidales bacterium]
MKNINTINNHSLKLKFICYTYIIILYLIINNNLYAQYPETLIRKGNNEYNKGKFQEAEKLYRKANTKDTSNIKALFNLGDALYKQKQYEQAANIFNNLTRQELDKNMMANVYHNIGNSLLSSAIYNDTLDFQTKQNKIKQSIEAYKKALKLKPDDNETRYNYIYASKLIKKIENQKQQKQENNKDKKQEKQEQQQQSNNNDKNQQNQQKQQKQQQQQQSISKQDAERMLEAIKNNEKYTKEKLDKNKIKPVKVNIEKDW